jgi:EmrB/QacA subfamily drug resistance transporter
MTQAVAVDRKPTTGLFAVACVSTLVVNANTSAVSILLPAISADVHSSVTTLQWAVTGYSLVGAAVIVTAGALGDVFGRRRVFLGGLALFVVSCVLIALAGSGPAVIAGRCIQGAAGSTILACGLSLLSTGSSGASQLRAVSLWGAAAAVGAAAGPLVGGVLADLSGWQGLFWIDAAIAAACIPVTMRTVEESRDPNRPRDIDLVGTVLVAAILAPFILGVSQGGSWGWTSLATIGCFAISAASVVGFVVVERRVRAPLVDLALLRNRVLVGATLGILISAGVVNALMYLFSIYAQNPGTLGFSALETGLATLPVTAALVATAPAVTPLTARLGTRPVIGLGFVLTTAGVLVLSFTHASWQYGAFVLPLVAVAVGLGLSNGPCSSIATTGVPPDQIGAASGISNMARYVGAAVLTATAASVYASGGDDLAAGFAHGSLVLTVVSAAGIGLTLLAARRRRTRPGVVDYAAAAAAPAHTITPVG